MKAMLDFVGLLFSMPLTVKLISDRLDCIEKRIAVLEQRTYNSK